MGEETATQREVKKQMATTSINKQLGMAMQRGSSTPDRAKTPTSSLEGWGVSSSLHIGAHNHSHLPSAQMRTGSLINSIEFAEPTQLRSRKVVTRSRFRSTGKYPSWKMGRMIQWESQHERNAFRLLDVDPAVTRFAEQPCIIDYVMHGEPHRHYPDIFVETEQGMELWEVKTAAEASQTDVSHRTAFLTRELPVFGYSYRLKLAEDLGRQPRLSNALSVLRYGRYKVSEIEREAIRIALNRRHSLLWSDACAGTYGFRGRQIICALLLHGELAFDMDSPLQRSTCFVASKGSL